MDKLIRIVQNIGKLLGKYPTIFLDGLWGTLWISAVVVLCGAVLGLLVATLRMSKVKLLNRIADIYIEILRGTPILLQLYLFYFAMPDTVPEAVSIIIALIVNASAYISEIIRAGIGAVDKGQWEAAKSLGLSPKNTMFRVILPQATKNILPALCNEFITTIKGTSLASVFFLGELMTSFKTAQSATFLAIESLIVVGVIYFVLNFVLSRLLRVLERRLAVSD
jgi:His/Glu/Gln/Arg/opine family amino acid ABC transporter permease subunit